MASDNKEQPIVRPAAAVILSREGQVWLGQRGATRFLPGFSVFPGGGCESGEEFLATAVRELFEETGVRTCESHLIPFARAITPAYSPIRFDVRVYRLEYEIDDEPQADGRELIRGDWYEPSELLSKWERGEVQLAPPTWRQVVLWNECRRGLKPWPNEQAFSLPAFEEQELLPVGRGLVVVPLRTQAMPPAAWTNSALLGEQEFYIFDPGGPDVSTLLTEINNYEAQGRELKGVVLSHHHPDHIDGYHALGLSHLPLWCHPVTAELLPSDFPAPLPLLDGDTLSLGESLTLRAHFTPGHAPGHLAFEIPQTRTLLAGDMISSLSSIVIPSDNGDLRQYLSSLEKLKNLNCNLIVPSHGPPYGRDCDPFGQAILHRAKREEQVFRLIGPQPQSPDELTHAIYRGLDSRLFPAARANVRHHLWKLRDENKISENPEGKFYLLQATPPSRTAEPSKGMKPSPLSPSGKSSKAQ